MAEQKSRLATGDRDELLRAVARVEGVMESGATGISAAELMFDRELRRLGKQLWSEIKQKGLASGDNFEDSMKKENLSPAELWASGEGAVSASTTAEVERYRNKLRLRADILTALLEETLNDLEKTERWVGADAEDAGAKTLSAVGLRFKASGDPQKNAKPRR